MILVESIDNTKQISKIFYFEQKLMNISIK